MDTNQAPVLYLRLKKYIRLPAGRRVPLSAIAQICAEAEWEEPLSRLPIVTAEQTEKPRSMLIDMMQVIQKIKALEPEMTIEFLGEPQVLVEFEKTRASQPKWIWVATVCLLLFMGSGLAIMNFHADVSMAEVHQKLYFFITGQQERYPLSLQIPYSFGLGLGMILFFNRILKKKMNNEPDPLELEMFNYQENINHYTIMQEMKKNHSVSWKNNE